MCGIAGIYSLSEKVTRESIEKMTDQMIHRGPDGEGQWVNKNIGLGHRRLSILDLSEAGSQPMHYLNQRYILTFNGEIYNYLEIKSKLKSKNYEFHTSTDTEVILAAFDYYGHDCVKHFDGMFALALWDQKKKELFCARDRFGEKPFYYYYDGKDFKFASELKALWAAGVRKEFDETMVEHYLKYGRCSHVSNNAKTFFRNIHNLKPGHTLLIDEELNTSEMSYWSVSDISSVDNTTINFTEAAEKINSILYSSVSKRLRSDVEVGSSLSGGLDSSIIVSLIAQIKKREQVQKTYSARFKNFEKDEGKHIKNLLSALRNVQDNYVWPSYEEFQDDIDTLIKVHEEPFGSASIYAQWKVMQSARENGTIVMLDGQGADEIFAGYPRFYKYYLEQMFFTEKRKYNQELQTYNNLRRGSEKDMVADYRQHESFRMKIGRIKNILLKKEQPYNEESLKNLLKYELQTSGLIELLRYADRNAMSHSVEVRLPFLDHTLVEFVLSLPSDFLLRNGWTKYILRKSFSKMLPESIAWRVDKIGYETPQKKWLNQHEVSCQIQNAIKFNKKNVKGYDIDCIDPWRNWLIFKYIS